MNQNNTTFIKHKYTKKEPWDYEVNIPASLLLKYDSTTYIYQPTNDWIHKRWNDGGGDKYWGLCPIDFPYEVKINIIT
jgi:hypothetical protein